MLIRDSGVAQLFAENAQEAYDLTVAAPRIAEHPDVLLPVLVCQDGFTITHSAEPVSLLADDDVARFVGPYALERPLLDTRRPTTHGPFAMPDYYYELRHQQAEALRAVEPVLDAVGAELAELSGRPLGAIERYRPDGAERVLVCLGSSAGTAKDVVDALRADGEPVGLLRVVSFRPFPGAAIAEALAAATSVVVLDRADSPGGTAPLHAELAATLYGSGIDLSGHVYGLGGRDLHPEDVRAVLAGTAPRSVGLRGAPCPV
jgi:pyruvate ferredoxin oxidoreductase alpha subunit